MPDAEIGVRYVDDYADENGYIRANAFVAAFTAETKKKLENLLRIKLPFTQEVRHCHLLFIITP